LPCSCCSRHTPWLFGRTLKLPLQFQFLSQRRRT